MFSFKINIPAEQKLKIKTFINLKNIFRHALTFFKTQNILAGGFLHKTFYTIYSKDS